MPFFENAIELDTRLISDYPEVVALANNLFPKIVDRDESRVKTKKEEYKSKETLKIILINLIYANELEVAVKYSRRKLSYSKNRRYNKIYFRYDRVIPIINSLEKLGLIENWKGFLDRERGIGRESRMAASDVLLNLFHDYNIPLIGYVGREAPDAKDFVQLRDRKGNRIAFQDDDREQSMTNFLVRYNKFIVNHTISFDIRNDISVSFYFLKNMLSRYVVIGVSQLLQFEPTENQVFIRAHGEDLIGYNQDGIDYIVIDGPGSQATKTRLINSPNIRPTTYRNYYINHISTLTTYNHTSQHPSLSPSITGTFYDIIESNQSLDMSDLTTVAKYVKKHPLPYFGISRITFKSNYQYIHRVFSKLNDMGGRFYGALHIGLPKEVRKCAIIDDEPARELDYKAHHIRMLYHLEKIDYRDDPYEELCKDDPSQRPLFKLVSLVSINAKNEKNTIDGIRKELNLGGYPFDSTDKKIQSYISKFKEIHQPISKYFNTGYGLELQYLDSQITEIILKKMTKSGIPCLPVHDSYIVPQSYRDQLEELMDEAYEKIMGFRPLID